MVRFSVKNISSVFGGTNLTVIQRKVCMETMPTSTITQKLVKHRALKVSRITLEPPLIQVLVLMEHRKDRVS